MQIGETEAEAPGLSSHLYLLNASLEALEAAALEHLVEKDLGQGGVQQLQTIIETNQQPQPM